MYRSQELLASQYMSKFFRGQVEIGLSLPRLLLLKRFDCEIGFGGFNLRIVRGVCVWNESGRPSVGVGH